MSAGTDQIKPLIATRYFSYALLSQMSFPSSHLVNTYTQEHENTGQLQSGAYK